MALPASIGTEAHGEEIHMGKYNLFGKRIDGAMGRITGLICRTLPVLLLLLFSWAPLSPARTLAVFPETAGGLHLDQALLQAQAGDTIVLAAGEYHPPDRLSPSNSGLAGTPITIKAEQSGQSVLNGDGNKYGFNLVGKSYIVIEGLVLKGHFTGCAVKLLNCHHVVLKSLTVSDSESDSVSITNSSYNTVEYCNIFNSQAAGLAVYADKTALESVTGNLIQYNDVHNNYKSGMFVYGYNNSFLYNKSYNNGHEYPLDHGIYCIGKGNVLKYNLCYDNNFGSGIRIGDYGHIVKNNSCQRNSGSGIVIAGSNDSHDIQILENLLEENRESGLQINSSEFKPYNIEIKGNFFKRNSQNLKIQKGPSGINIIDNIFTDPLSYQVQIDMPLDSAVNLSGNKFYGPVCIFHISGNDVPSTTFLSEAQPNTICSSMPYNLPPPANLRIIE